MTTRRSARPTLSVERIEQLVAIVAGVLVVSGVALIYPPAALIVAGLLLLASVIDVPRRPRP